MFKSDIPLEKRVATGPAQPHPTLKPNRRTRLYDTFSATFSKRFPQFALLPKELRLQIWESALADPKVHELHPCGKLREGRLLFRSNASTPPVILQVCRESRDMGLKHYKLMDYEHTFPSKPIQKFYYNPRADTLFLNTLTALYMTLILLEAESEHAPRLGIMTGWQNIAFDADRAHLISLLMGPQQRPQFKRVFPDLETMTLAFDFTRKGKTRFRTSVWPGEDGTRLEELRGDTASLLKLFEPIRTELRREFGTGEDGQTEHRDIGLKLANVKRKTFVRGNLRYGFRKTCNFFGLVPRGVFRLL